LDRTDDLSPLEKLFYKALFATCFFCWYLIINQRFRMDEAATLALTDVDWNCVSPNDPRYYFHIIHLDHR
jgi:hypothetical protein